MRKLDTYYNDKKNQIFFNAVTGYLLWQTYSKFTFTRYNN